MFSVVCFGIVDRRQYIQLFLDHVCFARYWELYRFLVFRLLFLINAGCFPIDQSAPLSCGSHSPPHPVRPSVPRG